jgi:hypothetical protein
MIEKQINRRKNFLIKYVKKSVLIKFNILLLNANQNILYCFNKLQGSIKILKQYC